MTQPRSDGKPSTLAICAAFLAVYIIWGSTYLGIRIAIESIPPFLMAGFRFVIAGGMLYAWMKWRGAARPTIRNWGACTLVGGLLLLGGNGGVVWAEQRVDSGLTALMVSTIPLWFAILDWVRPGGARPRSRTVIGLVLGFAGITFLVYASGRTAAVRMDWAGAGALVFATFSWACGSFYSKHRPQRGLSPLLGTAMTMIGGGLLLMLAGTLTGEWPIIASQPITVRSLVALVYLIVLGSLVGYTCYMWLLQVTTATMVGTYAYVNPVVAVVFGWLFAGEVLNRWMILAAGVILTAVVFITTAPAAKGKKREERVTKPIDEPELVGACTDS